MKLIAKPGKIASNYYLLPQHMFDIYISISILKKNMDNHTVKKLMQIMVKITKIDIVEYRAIF